MHLEEQLKILKQKVNKFTPKFIKNIMNEAATNLALLEIEKKALKLGDSAPAFVLVNAFGERINSIELLKKGPLVINFYRGAWCPFCNLELAAYQDVLPEIEALGGKLVAISPELPDKAMTLSEKHKLKFQILSDTNNLIAREFGIVFTVDKKLRRLYRLMNINLSTSQGNKNYELPVPATYIIDKNGIIILSHVDTDYTIRLDPSEVIKCLKAMQFNK
jgi:peroxiredoxin